MDVSDNRVGQTVRVKDDLAEKCQKLFKDFLAEFTEDIAESSQSKYYKEALDLVKPERNTLFVSFTDIQKFDQNLATLLIEQFYRFYAYLCRGLAAFIQEESLKAHDDDPHSSTMLKSALRNKDFYLGFYDVPTRLKIRELSATKIGTLMRITGQVVRTHSVHPELVSGTFECEDCGSEINNVEQQFRFTQPTICKNNICSNRSRFKLLLHKSRFADFQKIRVQETQQELPRGSMPRSLDIIIRGADQVEIAQAGDRCDFVGTLIVVPDVAQMLAGQAGLVRTEQGTSGQGDGVRGLKSLGVREMTHKLAFLANCCISEGGTLPAQFAEDEGGHDSTRKDTTMFKDEEMHKIHAMAEDKKIFENIISSLFPSIYGSDDIKRGILLQMFGGVPKTTEEGTTLRGDINVCVVGDPSTAKSQFLKVITDFAPTRAVYTSGKASSAAGLTAAVVRDEDGGFVIEAGALMLADQGICCIDEFDKMDLKDQIAIHEALEQQTISITKAGVKATLNARTSVLAAANPIGGHYDRSKSLRNNLSLSLPIMSRFDLFFVLLDECNEVVDYAIARKIVDMHLDTDSDALNEQDLVYSIQDIKQYLKFARQFKPKISPAAETNLVEIYKELRQTGGGFGNAGRHSWRITVRQLESLIRLSEAYAKLHCSDYVTEFHVKEAAKLLSKSIVKIEQPDISLVDEEGLDEPMEEGTEETADASQDTSKSLKLSYEKYKAMANMFVYELRKQESKIDTEDAEGMKRSELIEWYLNECPDIETEADLIEKKLLCDKVINRLITIDHILIPLRSAEVEEEAENDPILVVHPNYLPEEF